MSRSEGCIQREEEWGRCLPLGTSRKRNWDWELRRLLCCIPLTWLHGLKLPLSTHVCALKFTSKKHHSTLLSSLSLWLSWALSYSSLQVFFKTVINQGLWRWAIYTFEKKNEQVFRTRLERKRPLFPCCNFVALTFWDCVLSSWWQSNLG